MWHNVREVYMYMAWMAKCVQVFSLHVFSVYGKITTSNCGLKFVIASTCTRGFEGVQMNPPPLFNWNKEIVAFTLLTNMADR